jgi:hypothetical protein
MTTNMRRIQLGGLGQLAPLAAPAGRLAFKYLVGSVLAGMGASVIGEMLDGPDTKDSWAERSVFNARMQALHAGFLMVQCEVGGAQRNESYGCDDRGRNCMCVGGTAPRCRLPDGKRREWVALRDSFSTFYAHVGGADWFNSDWLTLDPDSAEVTQARAFGRSLVKFFVALPSFCPNYTLPFDLTSIVGAEEGTTSQQVAEQLLIQTTEEPTWYKGLKYATIGIGIVGVIWIGTTLRDAFKKR